MKSNRPVSRTVIDSNQSNQLGELINFRDLCPVVRTLVSTNPGLNFNPGFFFFLSKALSPDNFLYSF